MSHKTKDGEIIEISDLKDSHLINILKFKEKVAEKGFSYEYGGYGGTTGGSGDSMGSDIDPEPEYTEYYSGIRALIKNHYFYYREEAEIRKLKIDTKFPYNRIFNYLNKSTRNRRTEIDKYIAGIFNIKLKQRKLENK